MEKQKYSDVIERFLRYVQIDTESVPDMESVPSRDICLPHPSLYIVHILKPPLFRI